jgi:hypothetical protein
MELVLADLINGFRLDTEDQSRILGAKLSQELRDFLNATKN